MILSGVLTLFMVVGGGFYRLAKEMGLDVKPPRQGDCQDILELGIQRPNGTQAKKVQVELFYETLCPNVKNFIQGQLVPVWEDLSDIMEIHWKPYGFATVCT